MFCGECGCKLPEENVCPNCGAQVDEGAKFCRNCGSRVNETELEEQEEPAQEPAVCKACGKPLEEDALFCIYCGTKAE